MPLRKHGTLLKSSAIMDAALGLAFPQPAPRPTGVVRRGSGRRRPQASCGADSTSATGAMTRSAGRCPGSGTSGIGTPAAS